jgi:hypothetical protein
VQLLRKEGEMESCCDNSGCIVTQIMPPGEWYLINEGTRIPMVGWGLKECGATVPLGYAGRQVIEVPEYVSVEHDER